MYHSIIFYSIKFILLWVFFSWIQLCFLFCLHLWSSSLWFYDFLHGIRAIPEGCRWRLLAFLILKYVKSCIRGWWWSSQQFFSKSRIFNFTEFNYFCQLRKSNYSGFYLFNCSSFWWIFHQDWGVPCFFGDTYLQQWWCFCNHCLRRRNKDEETQFVISEASKKPNNRSSVQASSSMINCQHADKVDRFLQDHNCKKGEKLSDSLIRLSGCISVFYYNILTLFRFCIWSWRCVFFDSGVCCSQSSSSHMFTFVVDTLGSREA